MRGQLTPIWANSPVHNVYRVAAIIFDGLAGATGTWFITFPYIPVRRCVQDGRPCFRTVDVGSRSNPFGARAWVHLERTDDERIRIRGALAGWISR